MSSNYEVTLQGKESLIIRGFLTKKTYHFFKGIPQEVDPRDFGGIVHNPFMQPVRSAPAKVNEQHKSFRRLSDMRRTQDQSISEPAFAAAKRESFEAKNAALRDEYGRIQQNKTKSTLERFVEADRKPVTLDLAAIQEVKEARESKEKQVLDLE